MSLWSRDRGALLAGRLKNPEETPSVWPCDLDSSPTPKKNTQQKRRDDSGCPHAELDLPGECGGLNPIQL